MEVSEMDLARRVREKTMRKISSRPDVEALVALIWAAADTEKFELEFTAQDEAQLKLIGGYLTRAGFTVSYQMGTRKMKIQWGVM